MNELCSIDLETISWTGVRFNNVPWVMHFGPGLIHHKKRFRTSVACNYNMVIL